MTCLKDMTVEDFIKHRAKGKPLFRCWNKVVCKMDFIEYTTMLNYIFNHSKDMFTTEEEAEKHLSKK